MVRTVIVFVCASALAFGQTRPQMHIQARQSSRVQAGTPRRAWEAARDAFMSARFGHSQTTSADSSFLSTPQGNAQLTITTSSTVHHVSFGSTLNILELAMTGPDSQTKQSVTFKGENLPTWFTLDPHEQTLSLDRNNVAKFNFTVDWSAPINKEEQIGFVLTSSNGKTWRTSISITVDPPRTFELFQNYPNPFNPTTTISYQLPYDSKVSLKIYNLLGQEVATLVDGNRQAGYHQEAFSAERFSSGMYIYRIICTDQSGKQVSARKTMLVVK